MIEVLESLKYKLNQDLTTIGVSGNNASLPAYVQQLVNGRYIYTKTYTPEFLKGAVNYTVNGQDTPQKLIRDFIDLRSSYNPIELQANYLGTTIYDILPTLDITYFVFWYDQATTYSLTTVYSAVSSKQLYGPFSNSVGYLMLYTPSTETIAPINLATTDIKPYNRLVESTILSDIKASIDQGYKDANSSYAINTINIATGGSPTAAHGSRLVTDTSNDARYTGASSTYLSNLLNAYSILMYLTPLYATELQSVNFNSAPFFISTIEDESVVVDKLGNKVNTDFGWTEQVMFSAYTEE